MFIQCKLLSFIGAVRKEHTSAKCTKYKGRDWIKKPEEITFVFPVNGEEEKILMD